MMNARNTVIATIAATLLAWGAGSAFAAGDAQGTSAPSAAPMAMHQGPMNSQKWQQRHAKRVQALKEKLQLSDAQQAAWDAWQKAMQPPAHAALNRMDRAEMQKLTTPERIDRMHALREQRAAEADQRGQATKTFYAQLTETQQKVFDTQAMHGPRGARGGMGGMGRHHGGGQHAPSAS